MHPVLVKVKDKKKPDVSEQLGQFVSSSRTLNRVLRSSKCQKCNSHCAVSTAAPRITVNTHMLMELGLTASLHR